MTAPDLLDTNILVSAYDPTDRRKQQIARNLLLEGIEGGYLLSTQTLAEFAAVLLHKNSSRRRSKESAGPPGADFDDRAGSGNHPPRC